MIIYWHIYLLSSAVLNTMAAGLLALSKLEHDRREVKLNMEIQCDTGQMPSAMQPEACYHWDGLDWETPQPAWTINTPLVWLCSRSLNAFKTLHSALQRPRHQSTPQALGKCWPWAPAVRHSWVWHQQLKPNLQNQKSTVERRDGCRWQTS